MSPICTVVNYGVREEQSGHVRWALTFRKVLCDALDVVLCGLHEVDGGHVRDGLAVDVDHQMQCDAMLAELLNMYAWAHPVNEQARPPMCPGWVVPSLCRHARSRVACNKLVARIAQRVLGKRAQEGV
eukprot:scaffold3121_cov365-Prasinococcus_capsulatus_cf.AAC.1